VSDRSCAVFLILTLLFSSTAAWARPSTLVRQSPQASHKITRKLKIKKKPNPKYTDEARSIRLQGQVVLRVEFKADGTIGEIETLSGLPRGLTEKAIEAARLIEFEPEMVDGQPVSKRLLIMYRFRL
jgi:TonB family protein